MGTDKATLVVDGRPLVARPVEALRAAGLDVVAVGVPPGATPGIFSALGVDCIPDELPGAGPLAGVATALREGLRRGVDDVVILACDLPSVDTAAVGTLLSELPAAQLLVATRDARPAWPNARWAVGLLSRLDASIAEGERGFRSVTDDAATCELGEAIADADRPEDLPDQPVR